MDSLEKLLEIMARLRNPETGCPWDQQQDFTTIAPYTVEEAYEVADAIERNDFADLRDELGDLLFQVVFHARMAEELGEFGFNDVVAAICAKMIRRHPHVFGSAEEIARGPEKGDWQKFKLLERTERAEKGGAEPASSAIDGVAQALPALKRAEKLGLRAASVGFDWPDAVGPRAKIVEELDELAAASEANDQGHIAEELGDLLFSVVNLSRHLNVDPEQALVGANRKFERRFRAMEQAIIATGVSIEDLDLVALESHWQAIKE